MTRVLFLAQRTPLPDDGAVAPHGSGAHVAATLAALRARFDVVALGAGPSGDGPASAAPRALRTFVPARIRGARRDLAARAADRAFAEAALHAVAACPPDVVYERSEYMSEAGSVVAERLGVPLVLEVNGLHHRDARTMYRSALEAFGAHLERRKLRRADAVVTVSPGLAELLVELGADAGRLTVVPNTVPDDRVAPEPRSAHVGGAVRIGWIGHVMDWHAEALLLLARVAPAVLAAADVRFVVIGDGPRLDEVRARVVAEGVAGSFDFVGSVPYSDVPAALAGVDLGVIPDVFDYAFPVKLVEFGAAGIPVIAPRSASLDAQIRPGVEYRSFERGSADALRSAIVETVRDAPGRAALAAALHRAVRERFTWTAAADALEQLVVDLVESRR